MDNIYENTSFILKHKPPKIINSWLLILKIMLVLFIIFMFIPFNTYKSYIGYVSIEDNQSFIYLAKDAKLTKNLYIKDQKYDYEIVDINNYTKIKIDLEADLKINSLYLNISIRDKRKTLFGDLKNKIKKGLGL